MIMKFPGARLKALTLSYDDGVCFDKQLIEIMAKHGLKGTFNINSGLFSEITSVRRMSAQECLNLYESYGMEVAVHGLYHRFLEKLTPPANTYEVLKDRENLEALFGKIIRGMAYAYGAYSDKTVEALKNAGIVYSRTTLSTENFNIPTDWLRLPSTCHHQNPRLFELAEQFLNYEANTPEWCQKPQLFYLWGHSYEFNDNNNWDRIEKFAEMVGKKDNVWYATNIEIYDYIKAFESLIFSCDAKTIHNPCAIEVCIFENGKDITIKPGETIKL